MSLHELVHDSDFKKVNQKGVVGLYRFITPEIHIIPRSKRLVTFVSSLIDHYDAMAMKNGKSHRRPKPGNSIRGNSLQSTVFSANEGRNSRDIISNPLDTEAREITYQRQPSL